MDKELTLELTNYCPNDCDYCSSNATQNKEEAYWLTLEQVKLLVTIRESESLYDIIHLSGGEPLAHPDFYDILEFCKQYTKTVVVHSNAIKNIAFNPNVIDGIYVEAYLNVPETTDKIHVLKRVKQGRELQKPEVHLSCNWQKNSEECDRCNHNVLRYDGIKVKAPCQKFKEI